MNCMEAMELTAAPPAPDAMDEWLAALEHIRLCSPCRSASRALAALGTEREGAGPEPPPGALDRAVRLAAEAGRAPSVRAPRRAFWVGMGLGATLAAAAAWLAFAVLTFAPRARPGNGTPEVALALNETRDVNIAVQAPTDLPHAEIHVVLTGAIGLAGFGAQKELRWNTDLAAGANELTLPIVALGSDGGQLLVEVRHGAKRRTFIVDVKAAAAPAQKRTEPGAA